MGDGTRVRIADVGVGDQVTAWDRDSGLVVVSLVTATLPHQDTLIEATMSDGSVLLVTEDHRFWSLTDMAWVETQDLDSTNVLLSPDGTQVSVVALDWSASTDAMAWDLTVDDVHNFFVAADTIATPALVHNASNELFCGVPIGDELLDGGATLFGRLADVQEALDDEVVTALGNVLESIDPQDRDELVLLIGTADPDDALTIANNASLGNVATTYAMRSGNAEFVLVQDTYAEVFGKISANPDRLRLRFQNWETLTETRAQSLIDANPGLAQASGSGPQRMVQAADITRAWNQSDTIQPLDQWLLSYRTIRTNQNNGGRFQNASLDWLEANDPDFVRAAANPTFPDPLYDRGFIPDNPAWVTPDTPLPAGTLGPERGHHQFTEVKFLNSLDGNGAVTTNVLQPSSNAGGQIRYLIDNPPCCTTTSNAFTLMIGPNTRISPTMTELIELADDLGITVRVFQASSDAGTDFDLVTVLQTVTR